MAWDGSPATIIRATSRPRPHPHSVPEKSSWPPLAMRPANNTSLSLRAAQSRLFKRWLVAHAKKQVHTHHYVCSLHFYSYSCPRFALTIACFHDNSFTVALLTNSAPSPPFPPPPTPLQPASLTAKRVLYRRHVSAFC